MFGHEYLEFIKERQTKTRTGADVNNVRKTNPKIFATNDENCPVKLYKGDDQFYLQSNINYKESCQWFKKQPVEQNKISTIMKKMTENSGIGKDKRLTNTSARKHLITKLSDANIPDRQIVQISGHKNIQSINSYAQLSRKRQHEISDIMSSKTDNLLNSSNSSDVVKSFQGFFDMYDSVKCSRNIVFEQLYCSRKRNHTHR